MMNNVRLVHASVLFVCTSVLYVPREADEKEREGQHSKVAGISYNVSTRCHVTPHGWASRAMQLLWIPSEGVIQTASGRNFH